MKGFCFNKFFIILIPILLAGVMLDKINANIIMIALFFNCLCLNRREAAVALTLILPQLIGFITSINSINIPGSLLTMILAIILVFPDIKKNLYRKYANAIGYILVLIGFFYICYLIGGMSNNGLAKMNVMNITTLASILSFLLLAEFSDIDPQNLVPIFLLSGICFIAIGYSSLGYLGPYGLFDFESYRLSSMTNLHSDLKFITYHIPGIMGATAFLFMLSNKEKFSNIYEWLIIISSSWLILVSGARQAIFIGLLGYIVWKILKNKEFKISNLFVVGFVLFVVFFILSQMNVDSIQSIFAKNDSFDKNLNRDFAYSIKLIKENPLFGIGFGNYLNPITGEVYPHNIILELLCEIGMFGCLGVFFIIYFFFTRNPISLYERLPNNSLTLLIILPYIIRSLISTHIGANIVIFVSFFMLYSKKHIENNIY